MNMKYITHSVLVLFFGLPSFAQADARYDPFANYPVDGNIFGNNWYDGSVAWGGLFK